MNIESKDMNRNTFWQKERTGTILKRKYKRQNVQQKESMFERERKCKNEKNKKYLKQFFTKVKINFKKRIIYTKKESLTWRLNWIVKYKKRKR